MLFNKNGQGTIGIFDSGFGGLSVTHAISQSLPEENIIYIADTAFAPYGDRCPTWVTKRAFTLTEKLSEMGAKMIVIACNTATTIAIEQLRCQFTIPFVGVEPGIKPALLDHPGPIAILATSNTIQSLSLKNLIQRHAGNRLIILQPCPGFVELVEKGETSGPEAFKLVQRTIEPLMQQGIETLVLGCTHYYFLKDTIQEVAGKNIRLIETSQAIAKRVCSQLIEHQLEVKAVTTPNFPKIQFFSTQITSHSQRIFENLWPMKTTQMHSESKDASSTTKTAFSNDSSPQQFSAHQPLLQALELLSQPKELY